METAKKEISLQEVQIETRVLFCSLSGTGERLGIFWDISSQSHPDVLPGSFPADRCRQPVPASVAGRVDVQGNRKGLKQLTRTVIAAGVRGNRKRREVSTPSSYCYNAPNKY